VAVELFKEIPHEIQRRINQNIIPLSYQPTNKSYSGIFIIAFDDKRRVSLAHLPHSAIGPDKSVSGQ